MPPLDGTNDFIFAWSVQTFDSNKKKKNHQEKTKHHFFREHARMTSARSHISLLGLRHAPLI